MSKVGEAKRRKWADIAVIIASVWSLVFVIWSPEAVAPNSAAEEVARKGTWYYAMMMGGILGLTGYFVALKSKIAGKVLVGLAGVALLYGLTGFREIGGIAVANLIVPAIIMIAAVPFFGAMPTPEEEGKQR